MKKNLEMRLYKLLRWSEKYTKTDIVYLANGVFWLALGQLISSSSAFILAIAFANLAPPETFGTYRYILSIAAIFSIFTLPGMSTALTRAVAQGNESTIHAATRARIKYSFIGVVVSLAGSGYYFLNNNFELSLALLVIAISLPLFDTFTLYVAYLLGKKRFDIQTKYQLITQIASTACILAAIATKSSVLVILLSYFVPLIIFRIFFYFRSTQAIAKDTNTATNGTLTYGKHLTGVSLPSVIAGQIDKILMWAFFGPVELAIYAVSLAVPTQIQGLLKRAEILALPKLSSGKTTNAILLRKWFIFTLGTLPIALLYVAFAPAVFSILFPQYINAVFYSQLLAIIIILAPKTIIRAYIEASGEHKKLYFFHATTSVSKILLFLILVPQFGPLGAVISIIVNEIFSLLLIVFILHKKTK